MAATAPDRSTARAGAGGDGADSGGAPAGGGRPGLSRAVVWTGIALGTALAGLAISNGAVLQLPAMPAWLGVFLGAVLVWALIVLAAVTLAELTRRHHKAAASAAARHGKRGALAAGRAARRHSESLMTRAGAWAATRWQARQDPGTGPDGEPCEFLDPRSEPAAVTSPAPPDAAPADGATTTTSPEGDRNEGDITVQATSTRGPGQSRTPKTLPGAWAAVASRAADFIPGDDAELLEWMSQEVTGISSWAEALIEIYATLAEGIGVDPAALTLLHDVADAAAQCAETMGAAAKKFADHYERPRDFAADGGKFPHYGPWITGEGEA